MQFGGGLRVQCASFRVRGMKNSFCNHMNRMLMCIARDGFHLDVVSGTKQSTKHINRTEIGESENGSLT
eukprot:m.377162 g.377162  ORF g.377162 m.377162 type:complete len:69 (+) comp85680_c0_seq1:90-296(+)